MQRVPPPPNPGKNMLPMEITILLEQGKGREREEDTRGAGREGCLGGWRGGESSR